MRSLKWWEEYEALQKEYDKERREKEVFAFSMRPPETCSERRRLSEKQAKKKRKKRKGKRKKRSTRKTTTKTWRRKRMNGDQFEIINRNLFFIRNECSEAAEYLPSDFSPPRRKTDKSEQFASNEFEMLRSLLLVAFIAFAAIAVPYSKQIVLSKTSQPSAPVPFTWYLLRFDIMKNNS